ncbi:hypothetical protein [uncultured Mediterranean phage uvMED]|nr:hypothetical protein [uncultured Mediterranean phage uvMED]
METIIPFERFPSSGFIMEYIHDYKEKPGDFPYGSFEYWDSYVERHPKFKGQVRHTFTVSFCIPHETCLQFMTEILARGWKISENCPSRKEAKEIDAVLKMPPKIGKSNFWSELAKHDGNVTSMMTYRFMIYYQHEDHDEGLWEQVDAYESLDEPPF